MRTGEPRGIRRRTQCGAPLPTAGIEKYDVASRHFHALRLFQGLEIFPMDGRSRIEPSLGSGLSGEPRGIEENGSGAHAVLQSVDIPSLSTALARGRFHPPAL